MRRCWAQEAAARPSFAQLLPELEVTLTRTRTRTLTLTLSFTLTLTRTPTLTLTPNPHPREAMYREHEEQCEASEEPTRSLTMP